MLSLHDALPSSLAFGIAILLRLNQTIPEAIRDRVDLMDRRVAIEARYATCRNDASGHQLLIMEIDGHLRTIDQTGCGASSAPTPERNVVIVIDLYAAPGADLREAGGKAGPHQADMART